MPQRRRQASSKPPPARRVGPARRDHQPTFVGAGRFDGVAVANSEAIVSRIAGAELHVYEGGHLFFVQVPNALPDGFAFLGR